ncbi:MAG TPA: porin [Dongiaceae bacterium]
MKRTDTARLALLGTTAFATLLANGPACASQPIKLGVGGFFREAYMAVFDDDGEGELGNERNTDGFFNDAEVHFKGETTLDNGLTVGAHIELKGETNSDQIDETWIYFSGGFGELKLGSTNDALVGTCLLPPGGTANFSAFSPHMWGANNDVFAANFPALTSNAVCISADDREDAQKIIYISPIFGGFQLTLSYTPNGGDENHNGVSSGFIQVGGPHVGMPVNEDGESRHNFSTYATYQYVGKGWGLTAGGGGSFEGHVEQGPGPDRREQQFYQAGLNLTVGAFAVGGVFEYYNDLLSFKGSDTDAWVAGGGVAYSVDVWVFGAQYSHQRSETGGSGGDADFTMDRAVLTANYALGPAINVDGEIAYTWLDTDPESPDGVDDYDALEIGVGTAITF